MKKVIEVCLDSVESIMAAEKGGADRVELCSDLFEGGLSPSIGMVRVAKRLTHVPINAMVRPRGGDFCYSDVDFEVMCAEVEAFKAEGVNAIVFGILTPEGDVDIDRSRRIVELARPLAVTFHRAFDMTRDLSKSLEDLVSLGIERVLTSGGESSVAEGADTLKALVEQAGDRIVVMPGCGIKERNFRKLDSIIGAKEYHMSLNGTCESRMRFHPGHIYMGGMLRQSEFTLSCTDEERVRAVVSMS